MHEAPPQYHVLQDWSIFVFPMALVTAHGQVCRQRFWLHILISCIQRISMAGIFKIHACTTYVSKKHSFLLANVFKKVFLVIPI